MTNQISEDFANRLRKNLRRLKPFIKQGHSNAYRIYDADIPEYALAVDRYDNWLHVQEYAAPKSIDMNVAQQRLDMALFTLSEVLAIPLAQIALKQRRQQKGLEQYERQAMQNQWLTVTEHQAQFKVNMTDYLDTGLFLDHRPMRYWLQCHAKGKTVLNLFCYTASASVHAAIGGAKQVTSVDMSATYLTWAEDNFRLNGFDSANYRFIQADVLTWLQHCPHQYDIIFLDPPTFSNSKRMREHFDVQRDHVALIQKVMALLKPQGILIFSNNFRRFKLDEQLIRQYQVENYQRQSIPIDFERNTQIHQCWLIKNHAR